MEDSGNWCLIESDPGVFNELMAGVGVEGVECIEVYDTSNDDGLADAFGLIFLFKWEASAETKPLEYVTDDSIFFAKQVITNACASQALINVLLNVSSDKVTIGGTLSDFKSFVTDFDSTMKGTALANCEKLRLTHNSFARPQVFEIDQSRSGKEEEVYHFVGYVPINGAIYELDGLKPFPVKVAEVPSGAPWIDIILPIIGKRMSECQDGKFNLMALVPSRLQMLENRMRQYTADKTTPNDLIQTTQFAILDEKAKLAKQRSENIRRRHNYLPFIVELFKVLSEKGKLEDLVKRAKEKSQPHSSRAAVKA